MESTIIIILIILIIFVIGSKKEYFDVYYNHDLGSSQILNKPLREASRDSKYNWVKRDKSGMSVYDKYYEKKMYEKSTEPKQSYLSYDLDDIIQNSDPDPLYTVVNGEKIFLSQKNF
jgi:hypothetical protein